MSLVRLILIASVTMPPHDMNDDCFHEQSDLAYFQPVFNIFSDVARKSWKWDGSLYMELMILIRLYNVE